MVFATEPIDPGEAVGMEANATAKFWRTQQRELFLRYDLGGEMKMLQRRLKRDCFVMRQACDHDAKELTAEPRAVGARYSGGMNGGLLERLPVNLLVEAFLDKSILHGGRKGSGGRVE